MLLLNAAGLSTPCFDLLFPGRSPLVVLVLLVSPIPKGLLDCGQNTSMTRSQSIRAGMPSMRTAASNEITSADYILNVVNVPTISSFTMQLNFPKYLGKKAEIIQGTGNAVIPEGTLVAWKINTFATTEVVFKKESNSDLFGKNVFNENTMRHYLTKDAFIGVMNAIQFGKKIDRNIADQVASSMKDWALSKGVTHYTHWFQKQTTFYLIIMHW